MRQVLVIGIGAGDPDYLTVQAIDALNRVDVFFVIDKGDAKAELVGLRTAICERYIAEPSYRVVAIEDPVRDRSAPAYREAVAEWHDRRTRICQALIERELDDGECGGFLVWGDPMLYDSTVRIMHEIAARSASSFEFEVIPGITSVQALAAKHRIAINDIGEPVHITTGRKLAVDGLPVEVTNTVVMLDSNCSFTTLVDDDIHIYWGAYLGTPDEILFSGRLTNDTAAELKRLHDESRRTKGWIMSTYLLTRR